MLYDLLADSLLIYHMKGASIPVVKIYNVTKPLLANKLLPYSETYAHIVFFRIFLEKPTLKFYLSVFLKLYIRGSGIGFYVSDIHSRTMCVVPMERGCQGNSIHTKYSKSSKINLWVFRNKRQFVTRRV